MSPSRIALEKFSVRFPPNSEINLIKIGCISIKCYKFYILAYEQTPAKTYLCSGSLSIVITPSSSIHITVSSSKAARGLDTALTCLGVLTAHADLCNPCFTDCPAKTSPPHTETALKGERRAGSLALSAWQSQRWHRGKGEGWRPGQTWVHHFAHLLFKSPQ